MRSTSSKKIKPLWILLSERWGGPEQVAMSDMVDMAAAEVPISLICIKGSPMHAAALRHQQIQVRPLVGGPRGWLDYKFIGVLRSAIENVSPNIIYINRERLLWHLWPALWGRPDISVVASRHTLRDPSIFDFVRRLLLARLDYMIVLSESIRQGVLAKRLLHEKKVRVINLGLDFHRFDPACANGKAIREAWGVDKDTIVIGSVGRLTPAVGQDTFLKAAAGLLKRNDWKMCFVIVEEDPLVSDEQFVNSLKELVRQFHMEDAVTFVTLDDHLPDIMSAFDIFVMPGREEVPGLGALEALAMERPVVLSNVVGAEEIVGDREFGLLVRAEDAFDLQYKILNLLENPSVRLAMGTSGRQHVIKHFEKRTRFLRSMDIFERCLKRRYAGFKREIDANSL